MKQERVLREGGNCLGKKKFHSGTVFRAYPYIPKERKRHGSCPCLLGSMGDLSHQRGSVGDKRNGRACHGSSSTQGSLVPAQSRCQNPLAYMLRLSRDMNAWGTEGALSGCYQVITITTAVSSHLASLTNTTTRGQQSIPSHS